MTVHSKLVSYFLLKVGEGPRKPLPEARAVEHWLCRMLCGGELGNWSQCDFTSLWEKKKEKEKNRSHPHIQHVFSDSKITRSPAVCSDRKNAGESRGLCSHFCKNVK